MRCQIIFLSGLRDNRFSVRIENILIESFMWSNYKIIDVSDSLLRNTDRKVIVRDISTGAKGREYNYKASEIRNMRDATQFELDKVKGFSNLREKDQLNIKKMASCSSLTWL